MAIAALPAPLKIPLIKNNNILDFKPQDYQLEAYNKLKDINKAVELSNQTGKAYDGGSPTKGIL